jgi:CrcB protein
MKSIFLVALFGAAGSVLRYFFFIITPKIYYTTFPLSTFLVNLIGSFLIGFFIALFDKGIINEAIRVSVVVGLLGGFTTFSTFSMDMFHLINKSLYFQAGIYILGSVILGLTLFIVGHKAASIL